MVTEELGISTETDSWGTSTKASTKASDELCRNYAGAMKEQGAAKLKHGGMTI